MVTLSNLLFFISHYPTPYRLLLYGLYLGLAPRPRRRTPPSEMNLALKRSRRSLRHTTGLTFCLPEPNFRAQDVRSTEYV